MHFAKFDFKYRNTLYHESLSNLYRPFLVKQFSFYFISYDLSKSDVIPVEHLDDPIEISHEEYEELQRKHGEDGENGVLEISEDEYNELKARHKEKHEKVTDETGDTSEHNEQSVKHGQHHSEDKHGLYDTYDKQRLHKGSLSGEKQDSRQKLDKYAMKKCHTTRDTFIFKDKILYKESACWVLKEYTKTSFPYVRCS